MAEAVAKVFASGGHLAVAAGTGTGKSLAYLVPAVSSHKRVVVATATKALQDQLANKDLPLVSRGLGQPVKWAVLKGRGELRLPATSLPARTPRGPAAARRSRPGDGRGGSRPRVAERRERRPSGRPGAGGHGPAYRRRSATSRRLGRIDQQRRPGRALLRALGAGLVERERHRRRMPRRPPLPVGRRVFRGGCPRQGGRGGHRGREPSSSRR